MEKNKIEKIERKAEVSRELILPDSLVNALNEGVATIKEFKKTTRMARYYIYGIIALMIVVYVIFLGYGMWKSGGFENFVSRNFETDKAARLYVCNNEKYNETFYSIDEAIKFRSLFKNITCEMVKDE